MLRINPLEWLVVMGLLGFGGWKAVRVESWMPLVTWGAPALLLAVLSVVAKASLWVVFEAGRDGAPPSVPPALPDVSYGVAAGGFYDQEGFPLRMSHARVQIRWHKGTRPPELVVLSPAALPVRGYNETEADALVRWYPGGEVTPGRLWMGGEEWPAVRLTFVGRVLYLGLETEEAAEAVAAAMDLERHGKRA